MAGQSKLGAVFTYDSLTHAVAGACGGLVAMSTFYPLDTARYRLQVEHPDQRRATGTLELLQQLVRDEGFATLYRGLVPVLQSLWISNFVYFYTFHTLKALTAPAPGAGASALRDLGLGTVAGVINVLATTPFWVVNTRLKMRGLAAADAKRGINNGNGNATGATAQIIEYSNLVDGLGYVWRTEGARGLWAGAMPSLMLVSNPALQFMAYEWLKRQLSSGGAPSALSFFVIGAMAKAFATVATYPLQLIQTQLRHGAKRDGDGGRDGAEIGVIGMFVRILKAHGVAGLFRGLEAKLLQTVLTAALMFAAYEKIAGTVRGLLVAGPRGAR